jgi:hypothetical protein
LCQDGKFSSSFAAAEKFAIAVTQANDRITALLSTHNLGGSTTLDTIRLP